MLKALVISNCQVQIFKHALGQICGNIKFDSFPVHIIPQEHKEAQIAACVQKALDSDIIISVNLGKDFLGLETEALRPLLAHKKFFTIHNLYFTGYHPDLTYLGGLGHRVHGPMGDYHSQLLFFCFLAGIREEDCLDFFCDQSFSTLKYYQQFEDSLAELRRREAFVDIKFVDELSQLVRTQIGFISVNHPNNFLTVRYANAMVDHMMAQGIPVERFPIDEGYLINHLALAPIWPIYPEVARHHGLPTQGFYGFKPQSVGDEPTRHIGLREFIHLEYQMLAATPREVLMQAHQLHVHRETAATLFGKYLI